MNVYDFDDTIYDGESCLDLFFFYLKKTPYLLKYVPKVLHAFTKYKLGRVTVQQALDLYAPLVTDYVRGIPDFEGDIKTFWDGHMDRIRPFYKRIQRDDDIVITASPEISVREICRRLGIKYYVCSLLDPVSGEISRLCMRSAKVEAFRQEWPDAKIDNFYTDSQKNDAPLIAMAKHAYIVRGKKIRQVK